MSFDPITAILDIGNSLIDRIWPDPAEAAKAKASLVQLQLQGQLAEIAAQGEIAKAQLAVDQAEATNQSLFIAGGRPFILWVCGAAYAYHYLLQPMIVFIFAALSHPIPVLPVFDMDAMNFVMEGMLGLSAYRTVEKTNLVQHFSNAISGNKKQS